MVDDAAVVLARSPDCAIHWISDSVFASHAVRVCVCDTSWILVGLASGSHPVIEVKPYNRCTTHEKKGLAADDGGTFEQKRCPRTSTLGEKGDGDNKSPKKKLHNHN